jgi:HK97 family phage prohead protease
MKTLNYNFKKEFKCNSLETDGVAVPMDEINFYGEKLATDAIVTMYSNPLPLFFNHGGHWGNETAVIGSAVVEMVGGELKATSITINDTPAGQLTQELVKNGDVTGLSIGADYLKTRDEDGIIVIEELQVVELSIVPVPAWQNARLAGANTPEPTPEPTPEAEPTATPTDDEITDPEAELNAVKADIKRLNALAALQQANKQREELKVKLNSLAIHTNKKGQEPMNNLDKISQSIFANRSRGMSEQFRLNAQAGAPNLITGNEYTDTVTGATIQTVPSSLLEWLTVRMTEADAIKVPVLTPTTPSLPTFATVVPEGGLKPGFKLGMTTNTLTMQKFAVNIDLSLESINSDYDLRRKIERLLYNDLSLQIDDFFLNNQAIYPDPTTPGNFVTLIDALKTVSYSGDIIGDIAKAKAELLNQGYNGNSALVSPAIAVACSAPTQYYYGVNKPEQVAFMRDGTIARSFAGFRLTESRIMDMYYGENGTISKHTFGAGIFAEKNQFADIFLKDDITLTAGYINDNFKRNIITLQIEARALLAVYDLNAAIIAQIDAT